MYTPLLLRHQPPGLFDIDINTGVITLSSSLDFDAPGGRVHTISVQVEVSTCVLINADSCIG